LLRVRSAAQRGDVDVLLVWKLDRFGRSAFDLLGNVRQLEAAGVRFVSVTQGIDIRPGGDLMSRMVLTLLSAIAEFERDSIVERTRLGLANARRAGKRIGRPRVVTPPPEKVKQLRARGATWPQIELAVQAPFVFGFDRRHACDAEHARLACGMSHQQAQQQLGVDAIGLGHSRSTMHLDARRIDHDVTHAFAFQGAV
jgi:hypothetical protein